MNKQIKLFQVGPSDREVWAELWTVCHKTWIDSNFELVHLNDNQDLYDLIEWYNPEYVEIFKRLPRIFRIDIGRYLALLKYGGGYSDLDIKLFSDFSGMIKRDQIYIMGRKYAPHGKLLREIENSMIFSPRHMFWGQCVDNAVENILREEKTIHDYYGQLRDGNPDASVKIKYMTLVTKLIGADNVAECLKKYPPDVPVNILPEELFNRASNYKFRFTRHFITGAWRLMKNHKTKFHEYANRDD